MKKKLLALALTAALTLTTACDGNAPKTVEYISFASPLVLAFPMGWTPQDLHQSATIEVTCAKNEQYFIVLEEPLSLIDEDKRPADLDEYAEATMENMLRVMNTGSAATPRLLSVNIAQGTLPAKRFEFTARVGGVSMTYHVTLTFERDRYYQLIGWTPQTKFADSRAVFEEIAHSATWYHYVDGSVGNTDRFMTAATSGEETSGTD